MAETSIFCDGKTRNNEIRGQWRTTQIEIIGAAQ